jgi:hypothetical protein
LFKIWIVIGWLFFAVDAFFVIASLISRNMGDDAAGRGVAFTYGLVSLVFVLIGGAALYFSMRSHSWVGGAGAIFALALPLLLLFGADLESYVHQFRSRLDSRKEGRYPEPAQRDLAQAIRTADFAAMRKILATHPNLKGRDDAGFDLLSYAVMETRLARNQQENARSVEGVRLLLDAGMDPDESREPDGGSTFAGLAPNVFQPGTDSNVPNPVGAEVFRLFLEHGADPNTLREKQPLIFSVWGNVDSVREMLDHGADIDLRDANGDTPLLFYLWSGRWAAALLLLQRGADINVQNTFGTTPELALANGRHIAEEIMHWPLPDDFHKVQATLEQRRH